MHSSIVTPDNMSAVLALICLLFLSTFALVSKVLPIRFVDCPDNISALCLNFLLFLLFFPLLFFFSFLQLLLGLALRRSCSQSL